MNKEIKERIKYFKHYVVDNLSLDAQDDFQKILDYITNLQEENERLTVELNQNMIERNNYLSRNEKAIKCIKDKYYKEEYERKGTFTNKLMNILQGEDKDVKDKR